MEIIKYKNIGKKLITQVKKLNSTGKKVNVFIYDGCYVDDIIKEELKNYNCNIRILMPNIKELEDEIMNKIMLIKNFMMENMIVDTKDDKSVKKK